jgi:hypothetical protein
VALLADVATWADKAPAADSSHVDAADLADPFEAVEEVPLRRHECDGNHQRNTFDTSSFFHLFPVLFRSIPLSLGITPND